MNSATRYSKYVLASAIVLVACVVTVLAWWWQRSGGATGIDRVDLWLTYSSLVLNIPGWFIVGMFDKSQAQLATKLTDVLIPLLSGLIWGLVALLALKLSKTLWKYAHPFDRS
jgi:hypothetical protein